MLNKFNEAILVNQTLFNEKQKRITELENKIKELSDNINLYKHSSEVLVSLSKDSREKAVNILEKTVSNMLNNTLNEKYEFKIEIKESLNKPTVEFYIIKQVDGIESKQDVLEDNGGGVTDVISTALRFAFMIVYDSGIKSPIILDEPAKMLAKENSPMYIDFLSSLSKSTGKQIIICSHDEAIKDKADNTIIVKKENDCVKIDYK